MIRLLFALGIIGAAWYFLPWWGALIVTAIVLAVPMIGGASLFVGIFLIGWLILSDLSKKRRQKRYESENKRSRGY